MEIQGKYVKNMRKYKGTIIVLIVCMIFAYLYAHVDKKEYFYNRTVDVEKYANTGVICEKKLTVLPGLFFLFLSYEYDKIVGWNTG